MPVLSFKHSASSILFLIAALFLGSLIPACKASVQPAMNETGYIDGYAGRSAVNSIQEELKKSLQSIVRLQSDIVYRTYFFEPDTIPLIRNISDEQLRSIKDTATSEIVSRGGTAIVLQNSGSFISLLTASHIVTFPDTIWHNPIDEVLKPELYATAVSVRVSETFTVSIGGKRFHFDISVNDTRNDMALMKRIRDPGGNPEFIPFPIKPGNYSLPDWGDLAYGIGYPQGQKMVASGIISPMRSRPGRSFIIDAPFNRGFSGGAVLAVRKDGIGLEWVGMITSASAEQETFLVPDLKPGETFPANIEYRGRLLVRQKSSINYGITYAIGIEEINRFLRHNRRELQRMGVVLSESESGL